MENIYLNYKSEIQKINQRVKEYLWREQYLFKARNK